MSPILPIGIDRDGTSALYRQVELQLRAAIEERRLRPGQRLPSVRALAGQLGIGRLTVATAYEQLAADGYVVGRVGFGTVVAPYAPAAAATNASSGAGPRRLPRRQPIPLPPLRTAPATTGHPPAAADHAARFDLRPGAPGGAAMLVSPVLERLLRDAWREVGDATTPSIDPAGDPILRASVAAHIRASRGACCEPGQIVLLSGALIGISAIARLWLTSESTVVVEEPGDPIVRRALALSGARISPVPVDGRGLQTDALPPAATVAFVAPGVHVPTGAAMPLARRLRLLDWASAVGAIVVEDGRSDELVLRGSPLPGLQGLDEDGRVISIGAFESILHPGVRMAWAVVPPDLVAPFLATAGALDPGPSPVQQRALGRFLADGHLDRHLARVRRTLLERQERVLEVVGRELAWLVSVEPAAGGSRLILSVEDERWTAEDVVATAAEAGIALERLESNRQFVLDYGRADSVDLIHAIRLVARALSTRVRPVTPAAANPPAAVRPARAAVGARVVRPGRPGLVMALSAAGFKSG